MEGGQGGVEGPGLGGAVVRGLLSHPHISRWAMQVPGRATGTELGQQVRAACAGPVLIAIACAQSYLGRPVPGEDDDRHRDAVSTVGGGKFYGGGAQARHSTPRPEFRKQIDTYDRVWSTLTDAARATGPQSAAAFPTQVHEEVHTRDTRACDTLSSTRADVVLEVPVEISASSRLAQIT